MRLVAPDKGTRLIQGRALTETERTALHHSFTGTRQPTSEDRTVATTLLRAAWHGRQWIACSCRPGDDAPLFGIRRRSNDSYLLFRLSARPMHTQHCPFRRLRALPVSRPETNTWATLNRLLAKVITETPLNRYSVDVEYSMRYQNARDVIAAQQSAPSPIITFPSDIAALARKLRRQDSNRTGLLLTSIDSFDAGKMIYHDRRYGRAIEIPFDRNIGINTPLHCDRQSGGPYLVLTQIAETAQHKDWFVPVAISRIPIHDKRTWFPITSKADRCTVHSLLQTQAWLAQKHKRYISIEKNIDSGLDGFVVQQKGATDITVMNCVAVSEQFQLPEHDKDKATLYHLVLAYPDKKRQQALTRKFQQILTAKVLSTTA